MNDLFKFIYVQCLFNDSKGLDFNMFFRTVYKIPFAIWLNASEEYKKFVTKYGSIK